MHGGDGGFSGGHHGGGFGGHHHGGGFAGHHHNQGDKGGFIVSTGGPRRPRMGGQRPSASRYVAFVAFLVVFLTVLLLLTH
jgi:hypothetical protein